MMLAGIRKAVWLLLGLALLAALGCATASVSGTVTYEGKPVAKGKITFVDDDPNGAAAGTDIEGGRYSVTGLSSGKKRVYILIIAGGAPEQAPDQKVPPEAAKGLTAEITRGSQTIDFPL
jgi:hypothetical protein